MIDINDIPEEIKSWKPHLSDYNKSWNFISFELRYRITEHLAAIDYFESIYNWLSPGLVFRDVHKRMILVLTTSIYECVLSDAVKRTSEKELSQTKLLKQYLRKDKITNLNKDEFGKLINSCNEIGYFDKDWRSYLHKIREVRNWMHLAKNRDENILSWFRNQTIEMIKTKLEEFRLISENFFKDL